jgi:hypothetical protein
VPVYQLALDEDVTHRVASLLRAAGLDARSAKELGRLRLSDVQVLLRATDDGQTVVTHNIQDFLALHEAWITWRGRWEREATQLSGRAVHLTRHAGILATPHLLIYDLARILAEVTAVTDSLDDRLLVWNSARGWHEPLT